MTSVISNLADLIPLIYWIERIPSDQFHRKLNVPPIKSREPIPISTIIKMSNRYKVGHSKICPHAIRKISTETEYVPFI